MTTTTVSDAVILPQSQGTGLSGENATIDAAINGVLNRYVGGEYVSSTYSTGLTFQNHNATNDTVEVGPGIVFVQDNSSSIGGERGSGGNPQAESSTTSGYDTELPEGHTYAVLFPTATEISVTDSTLNEVYVDIDDVTANNSVNLEHDGATTASPGNTSLKIGETNPDDASADTRANDDASPTYSGLTVNGTTDTDALNAEETNSTNDVFARFDRNNDSSSITAGSKTNPFDETVDDQTGDINNSHQFLPPKNGIYLWDFYADIRGSTSSGDNLNADIKDITAGGQIAPEFGGTGFQVKNATGNPGADIISHTFIVPIRDDRTGDKIELRVWNNDSDFIIHSFGTSGKLVYLGQQPDIS